LDVFGSLVKPPFPGAVITDLSHFATNFAWSIRSKCRLLNDRGATLMGWIEYLATRFRYDHKSLAALRWRGRSVVAASRRGCTSRAKDSAAPGV
jgi:hypothetical protein